MIHANNTFSTIAGLGDTTILRGNFNVIGDKRDQVWMQSLRFGFGRKVSGSTYRYVCCCEIWWISQCIVYD